MRNSIAYPVVAMLVFAFCAFAQDLRTATLVGNVTDGTGAVVPNAAVTVTNTETQVVTRGVTNQDGAYYIPFLPAGNYRLTVNAPGFKSFEEVGLVFNAGETPRIDIKLELGAVTDRIMVEGTAPLLSTDTAVVGSIATAKAIHDEPIPQSKPQHFLYYMEGAQANNDCSYHILGQPETQLSYTLDGVNAKRALRTALGDTNTLITPPVDSSQEAQVFTTGIPAEIGHSAGGAYNLTTKSGTNDIHFSAEERYINKDWLHRQVFNQGPTTTPFGYHNFNTTSTLDDCRTFVTNSQRSRVRLRRSHVRRCDRPPRPQLPRFASVRLVIATQFVNISYKNGRLMKMEREVEQGRSIRRRK
jgi:hypothetical protein